MKSTSTKQLMIHADDLALCHAKNAATIRAMEYGSVNSGSIMSTCPWIGEIAAFTRNNPDIDLGVHLTLTNEWDHYRWQSVAPQETVPTLVDSRGLLHDLKTIFEEEIVPAEVEIELCAQIDKALAFGIEPTHLDTHDFVLLKRRDLLAVYLKVARNYGLPALFHPGFVEDNFGVDANGLYGGEDVWIDRIVMAFPDDYASGLAKFYTQTLQTLQPGLTVLLVHPAYDTPELQAITTNNIDCCADWRQQDFDFFSGDVCKKILEEEEIQMVTWRGLAQAGRLWK
jgi:predicted glycoside hydrolase/deacetylase ChbG (UPF0249 family)